MTKQQQEKQLRYDKAYMRMAMEWAKLSYSQRKQVGAIMVKDRMIISDGYNGTPTGFDNCCEDEEGNTHWFVLHAEANAIMKVAASTQSSQGATLYITMSPCNEGLVFLEKAGVELVHLEEVEQD